MLKLRNATSLFAALLILGSCSNSDELLNVSPENNTGDVETEFGESNVEIRFGRGIITDVTTRASASFDNKDAIARIGVFGLADEKLYKSAGVLVNKNPYDINWWNPVRGASAEYPAGTNTTDCILDNQLARKAAAATGAENDPCELMLWDASANKQAHVYYPISKFYKYAFYAYYPYQPDANIKKRVGLGNTSKTNAVSVDMTIDGHTDVLWGRAKSSEPWEYSAYYYHKTPAADIQDPVISLYHMLARLDFEVTPGLKGLSTTSNVTQDLKVMDISVKSVYTNISLCIADRDHEATCPGDMTELVDRDGDGIKEVSERLTLRGTATTDLSLKNEDGTTLAANPVAVPKEATVKVQVGDCMLLYPAKQYLLSVTLRSTIDGVVTDHHSEFPLYISNNSVFQSGKRYKVSVEVNDPADINLKAQVIDWVEAEGDENPTIEL